MLVDLDTLPAATPHMVIARAHRWGLGGTSAGKALNLARLGVPTTLRTVLGTDPDAAQIASALAHPRLTLIPDVVDGPSEHHLNLLSAAGERISIYLDLTLEPPALPGPLLGALQAADIAVIDLTMSSLPVLDAARAVGCEIWCDIHDYDGVADFHRPFIDAADVLIVSADRLKRPRPLPDRQARRRNVIGRVYARAPGGAGDLTGGGPVAGECRPGRAGGRLERCRRCLCRRSAGGPAGSAAARGMPALGIGRGRVGRPVDGPGFAQDQPKVGPGPGAGGCRVRDRLTRPIRVDSRAADETEQYLLGSSALVRWEAAPSPQA